MNDDDIQEKFKKIEKRIEKLEEVFDKKEKKLGKVKTFKGLVGGINFIINNNFFDKPQLVNEVFEELRKDGYHYSIQSIDKALRDFTKTKKVLTRIEENGKWKYVIRK